MENKALTRTSAKLTPRTIRVQTAADPVTFVAIVGGVLTSFLMGDATAIIAVSTAVVGLVGAAPYLPPLRMRVRSRLRQRVARKRNARRRAEERALLERLTPPLRERYLELKLHVREVPETVVGRGGASSALTHIDGQLSELLISYLRLLSALHNIDELLASVDELTLYRQLEDLAQQAAVAPPKLRAVKMSRREILLRRRNRLEEAREHRDVVTTQLGMVEDIVRLLRETSLVSHDPETLGAQLNEVMMEVEAAEEAIREVNAIAVQEDEELARFEERVAG